MNYNDKDNVNGKIVFSRFADSWDKFSQFQCPVFVVIMIKFSLTY